MILYFDLRKKPLFKPYLEASGIRHQDHYRNRLALILQYTPLRFFLPSWVFYRTPEVASDDDKIIVFDSKSSISHVNRICRKFPDKRVIMWFWNPVTRIDKLREYDSRVELWTYSERDSVRLGINLNTQFYFDCLAEEARNSYREPARPDPRVLFIGRDKGRVQALKTLAQTLREHGAAPDFRISDTNGHFFGAIREELHLIPYREVVDLVKESDILLDYYLDPESGLSLRPMEALFWGKKLITNHAHIKKQDFYESANIYILGEERSLEDFFNTPYKTVDPRIRDKYLLSRWIGRFDCKE